jgi:hypothetical protein
MRDIINLNNRLKELEEALLARIAILEAKIIELELKVADKEEK